MLSAVARYKKLLSSSLARYFPHTTAYLRAVRGTPTLTVGETPEFRDAGGIVTFVLDRGNVRFEVNTDAATQNQLRISSRLLRLAVNTLRGNR